VRWEILFHDDFRDTEWRQMDVEQRQALLAAATALSVVGPSGARPLIDTLKKSRHKNMKELRYKAHGGSEIWRAAFAFDPQQHAIILVAGDKQGTDEALFYKRLITKADQRLDDYLVSLQPQAQRELATMQGRKKVGQAKPRSAK
jgi:hypothetical protein